MRAVQDKEEGEQTGQHARWQPVRGRYTETHGQERSQNQGKRSGYIDIAECPLVTRDTPAFPAISQCSGQAQWQTDRG